MFNKVAKAAVAASTALSTLLLATVQASAYSSYDYNDSTGSNAVTSLFSGAYCVGIICWIVLPLFWLISTAFTIWMIVDVTQRDESVLPKKTLWLVLMAVGIVTGGWSLFVALYYYFARKKKLDGK